jgi:hypothetical protein
VPDAENFFAIEPLLNIIIDDGSDTSPPAMRRHPRQRQALHKNAAGAVVCLEMKQWSGSLVIGTPSHRDAGR